MYLVDPYVLATGHGRLAAALGRLGHYLYGFAQALSEIHALLPRQQEATERGICGADPAAAGCLSG